MRYISIEK